jgi:hypothetical protein
MSFLKAVREEREREARYRAVTRHAFRLAGAEVATEAAAAVVRGVLNEIALLTDEIGVTRAEQLLCEERSRWLHETGKCPLCGGPPHA